MEELRILMLEDQKFNLMQFLLQFNFKLANLGHGISWKVMKFSELKSVLTLAHW